MMEELINPYIAGAPVTESSMFFGRRDVFDWIENSLVGKYADNILVVHGQRRVGKTSVLKQLNNRLPARYIPVFFDLQGRTSTTLDRFLWWLARETVRVLKHERDIEVPIPKMDDFAKDLEFFENEFLPILSPSLRGSILLFTFDEFDNLEESEVKEELAKPLINYLRRLMGRDDISFIFSIGSSGNKLENMQAGYTDFFKTALYKKISFLSEDQTHMLIKEPVEGLIEYDKSVVKQIYKLTSGHPYFTQLTCHELFALCQRTDQRRIREDDLKAVLDDVVERGTVNLKFTWDEASDIEKWSLASLAHLEKTDRSKLNDFLKKQRVRFSDSDLTSSLLHLREKDVITDDNQFVIHLLKLWLQKNRPVEQVREELTEVNPIANRYNEIGLEFKDGGFYNKALDSFLEALAVAPDNIQAQLNIAQVYMDQKDFNQAVVEFEKVLVFDDEHVVANSGLCEAHLALGDAARERKRIRDAVQSYKRVLKINKEHLEARQRMAEISRQRAEKALNDGKDEEALSAFAEALNFTPEDPQLIERAEQIQAEKKAKVLAALITRVDKQTAKKDWEQAQLTLKEGLEISPGDQALMERIENIKANQLQESLDSYLLKADQEEKAERWDAAISALNDYLALKPDEQVVQQRRSELVITKRSTWLESILGRSSQAVREGKWELAVAALNEVLDLEPENEEIKEKITQVREAKRKAHLDEILTKAEEAVQAKNWDQAITALNDGLSSNPDNEEIKAKLVEVREVRRLTLLQAAIRQANLATQAGKWEIAVEALNLVLETEPDNSEIKAKLVEVRTLQRHSRLSELRASAQNAAKSERFEEALQTWEEYLDMEPDDRLQAEEEMRSVKELQELANTYTAAQKAFSNKNYDRTIGLTKEIIARDVNYKDASLLLAEAIELRRTSRKWWQNKWLWRAVSILGTGIFAWAIVSFVPQLISISNNVPAIVTSTIAAVVEPTDSPTLTPTVIPTTIPVSWSRLNSGQIFQRATVTAIAIDPVDPGVIYVGTDTAGIYKSIDGGTSWQPSHSGLHRTAIDSIIIDPVETNELYAGTYSGGVYKTSNNGNSWEQISTGIDEHFEWLGLVFQDSENLQRLFFTSGASTGIFKTENGGKQWNQVKDTTCPDNIVSLVVNPIDSNILLAGNRVNSSSKCDGGVYISLNGGGTWEATDLPVKQDAFVSLWISHDGSIIFAQIDSMYRSLDGGNNWVDIGIECDTLAFDPQEASVAYCGNGESIQKTNNGGDTWQTLQKPDTVITTIEVSEHNKGNLFIGGLGLFISSDDGSSWQEYSNGLGGSEYEIILNPKNQDTMITESVCSMYISTNKGNNWIETNFSGCGSVSYDALGKFIYGTNGNQILRSSDGGETWQKFDLPDEGFDAKNVVADDNNPNVVFALYDRGQTPYIYRSDDGGETWQETSGMQDIHDTRLFFGNQGGNTVYAVGDLEISKSNNGGVSWVSCPDSGAWHSRSDKRLIIDPRDDQRLILATRGEGILISTDGCQNWQSSNTSLDSLFVNTVSYDPNHVDTIYAGTDGGAFVSYDGGQNWGEINDGLLGATVVYSIVVDDESNVYAATPYGIFQLLGK